jgi:formylglycine-generating enzyme required for sulfatase activity
MFDEIPLPADWPVYASHAEASAYARWVDKGLPTEAQWHRAAYGTHGLNEREYPWADDRPVTLGQYPPYAAWDPAPVNATALGASAFGVEGLLANGWEWTSTEFAPFPGFRPFPCYPGYSAQFFDGKHYVLKGGSVRTAPCMLRRSFRNWFQSHYQYVYAGFRCASRQD